MKSQALKMVIRIIYMTRQVAELVIQTKNMERDKNQARAAYRVPARFHREMCRGHFGRDSREQRKGDQKIETGGESHWPHIHEYGKGATARGVNWSNNRDGTSFSIST